MKIAIGSKFIDSPWGGGNLFIKNIVNYFLENDHEVVYDLSSMDIDIIFIIDPRSDSELVTFTPNDVKRYKKFNNNVKIVHRINECDERKETKGLNKYYINENKIADFTVFVSEWLKNIYKKSGMDVNNSKVIMSGADTKIFNNKGFEIWDNSNKFKIVTHHWGNHWNKGFETYKYLDELLDNKDIKKQIEFTYIGNLPKNLHFKNTNIISPLNGEGLAKELKKNNAYLTGTINEPSGNHHIEASQCGLPVLYIDSGGVKEFCQKHGIEFTINNLQKKIFYLMENYTNYFELMKTYPFNSQKMCKEYENLFLQLLKSGSYRTKSQGFYIQKIIFILSHRLRLGLKFRKLHLKNMIKKGLKF